MMATAITLQVPSTHCSLLNSSNLLQMLLCHWCMSGSLLM